MRSKNTDVEALERIALQAAEIRQLQEAVHTLIDFVRLAPPTAQWARRTDDGGPLPHWEPFITHRDVRGHVVKLGVGDRPADEAVQPFAR